MDQGGPLPLDCTNLVSRSNELWRIQVRFVAHGTLCIRVGAADNEHHAFRISPQPKHFQLNRRETLLANPKHQECSRVLRLPDIGR